MTAREDLIQTIATLAPPGSGPVDPQTHLRLRAAVRDLIALSRADGLVIEDPRTIALTRKVTLDEGDLARAFENRRILITGAAGCVAGALIPRLLALRPAGITGLDTQPIPDCGVERLTVDIRDKAALWEAFARVRPQIVFHLAAVREPPKAERCVQDAITTNALGVAQVIQVCEEYGVETAVYSSTGKCFAYNSDHVYTCTKKLAEALWSLAAARNSSTRFAFTRFTHLLENGLVFEDIERGLARGLVEIHGPQRHFNLQNLDQATGLLLHAAMYARPGEPEGWIAADLGWPVNVLEFALWRIHAAQADSALRFLGVPPGYDERFFRGQFDWSGERDVHPLVNALESPSLRQGQNGTVLTFRPLPIDEREMTGLLEELERGLYAPGATPASMKADLIAAVDRLAAATFLAAAPDRLQRVLAWGVEPARYDPDQVRPFERVISLICQALIARGQRPSEAAIADLTLAGLNGPLELHARVNAL